MKDKVVWTTREWRQIAQYFVDAHQDPNTRGFTSFLRDAQEACLPKDRYRNMSGVTYLRHRIKELIHQIQNAPGTLPPPVAKVVPAPMSEMTTEALLVELARRIARFLDTSNAPNPVDRGFHPRHNPEPKSNARQETKHVLVVGPSGQQQERLRKMFPNLRLSFVTCEDSTSACAVGRCDLAILWTKFMNHAQQDSVKVLGYPILYANTLQEVETYLGAVV